MQFLDRADASRCLPVRKRRKALCGLLAVAGVLALSLALPAAAQTDTWLRKTSPANWTDPSEWSLGVPDGSTEVAILLPFSVVNVDSSYTNSLTLTIGAPATANLLSGTTLTNSSTGVISDAGNLTEAGGSIVNQGAVQVTAGGTLTATSGGGIDNTGGTIDVNGGTLLVGNITGGTVIVTGGGKVELSGTVAGTTLDNVSGTVEASTTTPLLDGSTAAGAVTIQGEYDALDIPGTVVKGTINNQGNIVAYSLGVDQSAALQGGGTVTLFGSIATHSGPATLENVNNTVAGYGFESVDSFVNDAQGIVNANVAGKTLAMTFTGSLRNSGLLEAAGGILTIGNGSGPPGTFDNTGGSVFARFGQVQLNNLAITGGAVGASLDGNVQLNNSTLTGGTITAALGGTVLVDDSDLIGTTLNGAGGLLQLEGEHAILDGSTAAGAVTIQGTVTVGGLEPALRGTINNQGTLQVSSGGIGAQTDTTLTGGGTVALAGTFFGGSGTVYNLDNTIRGFGSLQPITFVNLAAGVVSADVVGQALTLAMGVEFLNSGTVEVAAGSTLALQGGATFFQGGGRTQIDGTVTGPFAAPLVIAGGLLQGTGTIETGVIAAVTGTVQPGDPGTPGTLVVEGYTQRTGATFEELIGASGNGELVALLGGIVLESGALLDIELLDGFTPSNGETFTIMDSILITGEFANAPPGSSGFEMDGWDWSIEYLPGEIDLEALNSASGGGGGGGGGTTSVPEPDSLAMLGAGLIMLTGLRVRRRLAVAR